MSTIYANPILFEWLHRPRKILWELTFGLDIRRQPNIRGEFAVNLAYLDDQGEKWGDTHIKIVGQHYEDYAHWDSVSTFLPVGGLTPSRTFLPNSFTIRSYKDLYLTSKEENLKVYLTIDQWGLMDGSVIIDEKNLGDALVGIHRMLFELCDRMW